jgi:hypothetical protein
LWALLVVAASARLLLHAALMPPFAGLDEIYHVARLSFVEQEGRNPNDVEASVAPYVAHSIDGYPGALPAFSVRGEAWPRTARALKSLPIQHELAAPDFVPYVRPNYEAQQPSLYYSLAAPLVRLVPRRTPLSELQVWRMFSLLCALIVVLSTASIARLFAPQTSFLAAALVVSLPTWLTLVVRASNDALACAFIALGLAISLRGSRSMLMAIAEAVCWGGAIATKLYSWPIAGALLLVWWGQRADRRRVLLVCAAIAVAALATIADLHARTHNPLGLFAFDSPTAKGYAVPIAWLQMLKIFVATGVWTSGQHWNAMTVAGMAAYVLPLLFAVALWLVGRERRPDLRLFDRVALLAVALFLAAQCFNAAGYIRQAHALSSPMPAGGKEGWYLYSLVPLFGGYFAARFFGEVRVWLAVAAAVWIALWDVIVHEGALYADFAGFTSAQHAGKIFRWGRELVGNVYDSTMASGPLQEWAAALRVTHLLCLIAIIVVMARTQSRAQQEHIALT